MPPDYEDTVHWFTAGLHRQPWAATFALAGGYTPVVLSMWAALFGLLAGAFAGAGLVATNKFTHTIGAGASGVGLVFAGIASGVVTALAAFGAVYTALFVRDPLQTILALILGGLITLGIVASIVRYEGDLLLVRGYRRPSRDEARLLAPAVQSVGAGLRLSSFPRFCVWDSAAMGAWTHMRHIVISTGLLQTLEPAELEAVIAHEMHHWRNGDSVALRVVWAAGLPISVLYNIGCLLAGKSKAQTLRVSRNEGVHMVLTFIGWAILWPTWVLMNLVIGPAVGARARQHEYDADAAAAQLGLSEAMVSALRQVAMFEAGRTGWEQVMMASHPPTALRIEALQQPRPDDADFQEGPLGHVLGRLHH